MVLGHLEIANIPCVFPSFSYEKDFPAVCVFIFASSMISPFQEDRSLPCPCLNDFLETQVLAWPGKYARGQKNYFYLWLLPFLFARNKHDKKYRFFWGEHFYYYYYDKGLLEI